MNYIKTILFLLCSFFLTIMVHAQSSTDQRLEMKREIFKTFHKRSYTGEYPLRQIPILPSTTYQTVRRAKTEAPLFTDRVWFPGEWEEVKAIILTPYYESHVPGHEDDLTWNAEPMVKDYANYYHKNEAGKWVIEGGGPYTTSMDTVSDMGKVFLRLMDGIQKGGAEAWVRVTQQSDTALVYQALKRMGLRHDRLRFIFGQGSSFWYRDCGPICFYYGNEDRLAMLDFFYRRFNRALDDEIPSLLHGQMGIPNYITDFVWEGGNCLVDGAGSLVTSDAVYTINNDTIGPVEWDGKDTCTIRNKYKPALTQDEVRQALQEMLGQRATHIVPRFLYDGGTGHMDLYADAWNENGFVFSGMPERYGDWHDYITESGNIAYLNEQKSFSGRNYYTMARLPFPSDENGDFFKDENEYNLNYSRTYANHTFVNDLILQPCFSEVGADGMPTADWDRANIEAIKRAYPGYTIYCVDVREFDGSGGAIHCVTKQIPADNPIRILHKNIHGRVNPGELTDIPFSAIITNKSGITHAELMYRTDGGQWQRIDLTSNGNRWYGSIPANALKPNSTVEYYIQATSGNGKTITKPFTAHHGGCFSFTLSTDTPYDAGIFDFNTQPMPMEDITFTLSNNWIREDTSKDDPTGIIAINDLGTKQGNVREGWFTLSGIRLSTNPTKKGIYIFNGKKYVVR